MPRYHFNLRNGQGDVTDEGGIDLPDLAAAREYARGIARDLMFRCKPVRDYWVLSVCDSEGSVLSEVPFIEVDDLVDRFGPATRQLLIRMSKNRLALAEAMFEARMGILSARATIARARSRPHLAARHGRPLVPRSTMSNRIGG